MYRTFEVTGRDAVLFVICAALALASIALGQVSIRAHGLRASIPWMALAFILMLIGLTG